MVRLRVLCVSARNRIEISLVTPALFFTQMGREHRDYGSIFPNSTSSITGTPSSFAFSSFEPASVPART